MLTEQQIIAAGDLIDAGLSEREVIEQHRIDLSDWLAWLEDPEFQGELQRRAAAQQREAQYYLLRHGPLAARKLVALLSEQDKPDTVRRAALDILDRCLTHSSQEVDVMSGSEDISGEQIQEKLLQYAAVVQGNKGAE